METSWLEETLDMVLVAAVIDHVAVARGVRDDVCEQVALAVEVRI